MATRDRYTWLVRGGVVLGLLLLAGCQGGTAGDTGVAPEPELSVTPAAADVAEAVEEPPEARTPEVAKKAAMREESREEEQETDVVEPGGPPVTLALRFEPGQTGTYRVTTSAEKGLTWEGNTTQKPGAFKGGRTGNHVEMTFDQRIVETDAQGYGVVEITITALRYLGRVRNEVRVDFDSSRTEDQGSPLARLIGQRYRLQVTPKGKVVALLDVGAARAAVQGKTPEHGTARRLVSDSVIRKRHEIPALLALEAEQVRPQEQWSSTRTLSYGMMGARAYERVYTLAGVEDHDGREVAVVEMKAIPSAVAAEELHSSQPMNPFAPMFDSQGNYEGRLTLDLDTGMIGDYVEQVDVQWIAADTTGSEEGADNPAVLKMVASELYKLERVE